MSGQLVGEVLDAAEAGELDGLSERGFHALIAIAEKCHTNTRQGSVRWDRIRAGLYGASLSTAKRAVLDLKSAGVIRVVKRGFDNHVGRACAPIYEIQPLGERVTQVTQSPPEPTGQTTEPTGQIEKRTGQIGERTGHPGDLLDGSIDGPIDGSLDDDRPTTHCTVCLDRGIVLNSDGKPGRTIRICHHDHSWHKAQPDELAEVAGLLDELNIGAA